MWQRVLDAVDGLDVPVEATLGPAVSADEVRVPGGVRVHEWMPHHELFPTASLVVSHGGHGTTLASLAHGVPVGGELDYLDEGTIVTAIKSRSSF